MEDAEALCKGRPKTRLPPLRRGGAIAATRFGKYLLELMSITSNTFDCMNDSFDVSAISGVGA